MAYRWLAEMLSGLGLQGENNGDWGPAPKVGNGIMPAEAEAVLLKRKRLTTSLEERKQAFF